MKKSVKLELRAIDLQREINGLEVTEANVAKRRELLAELDTVQTERRTALEAEANDPGGEHRRDGLTPEERERVELRAKSSVVDYTTAAVEKRSVDGAAAEYNASLGLASNHFPLQLLAGVEDRATTDTDGRANQSSRWIDRLFSETSGRKLGLTYDTVAPGATTYPITTAGASTAQRGRREAATDAAWTTGVVRMEPTRNTVRAVYTNEDDLRLPGLASALERDLRMALTEGVDRACLLGDNGANENSADITGLTTATDVVESTLTQSAKVTKGTLDAFTALVDGKHAETLADLSICTSVGAWRLWENTTLTVANETASVFKTLSQYLKEAGLSWSARGDIDTNTANNDWGAFIGRKRGIAGAGVVAMWEGRSTLIVDPYVGAAKGEVALTLSYYWNFGLPRPTNFARLKFVT